MTLRQTHTITVAAAKAGISQAKGYQFQSEPTLPSQKKKLRGHRRPDPLADIFDTEVVPMLQSSPGIRPVAVFEEVMRTQLVAWVADFGKKVRPVIFVGACDAA